MGPLPVYIHVLLIFTSVLLTAPPGCYPPLSKQLNYMFAQLLMHLATALGCSSLIYGCKLHLQELLTGLSQAPYELNEEQVEKKAHKSTAHFLIMWEPELNSLLPQNTLQTVFFPPNVKVSPNDKAIKHIHTVRVLIRSHYTTERQMGNQLHALSLHVLHMQDISMLGVLELFLLHLPEKQFDLRLLSSFRSTLHLHFTVTSKWFSSHRKSFDPSVSLFGKI